MRLRKRWIGTVLVGAVAITAYSTRAAVARTDPCTVVYYSFDGAAFTFDQAYQSGSVGPFTVGQTKEEAIAALSSHGRPFILPMTRTEPEKRQFYLTHNTFVSPQMRPLLQATDEWSVAVRSCGKLHAIYTPTFAHGRLQEVRLFNSALQGL